MKKEDARLVKEFLSDARLLSTLPVNKKYKKLALEEYPFDEQLLNLSPLYRNSRAAYLSLGGKFKPAVCSTMRSLSTQDLFKDEIHFSPMSSELLWLAEHGVQMADAAEQVQSLKHFHAISLFHEQNHRIIWRLLPPPPSEKAELRRYLNFAESLVVMLDIALGDEAGSKLSPAFERMSVLYRSGGKAARGGKSANRHYLLSVLCASYFTLERMHADDILPAVNYIFPGQNKINKLAVKVGMELNRDFTEVTNPMWQELYWEIALKKLRKLHKRNNADAFYLAEDPLDLGEEFFYARLVLNYFGL